MICPNCMAQYREGYTQCSDCFIPLINVKVDESQVMYDIEMAKIKYLESFIGTSELIEIHITKPARALRFLRLADYLLVITCSFWLLGCLSAVIYEPVSRQLTLNLFAIAIFSFSIYTGYRHIGIIDNRIWYAHIIVLPILMILLFMLIRSWFILLSHTAAMGQTEVIMTQLLYLFSGCLVSCLGLVSVLLLMKMRIAYLDIPLFELLNNLRSQRGQGALDSRNIRRINKPLGVFFGVIGGGIFLGHALIRPVRNIPTITDYIIPWLIDLLSLSLLAKAQGYFQVNADSLLIMDDREPILFLRSFDDDEKQKANNSFKALLDFSLETRLSNHFSYFGPFIAIGSPNEAVPVPGAARVTLPHSEWLLRVSNWISESSLIIMYSGKTNWVNWELAKIIEMGRVQNLILIMPQPGGWRCSPRDISARFDRLREAFKNTRWCKSIESIQDLEDVRALLFGVNGSIVVINSRPCNRDSFHLAALVAHYLILNHYSASDLIYRKQGFKE